MSLAKSKSLPTDEDIERAREHGHINEWDDPEDMVGIMMAQHGRGDYHTCWEVDEDGNIQFTCDSRIRSAARLAPESSVSRNRSKCDSCI